MPHPVDTIKFSTLFKFSQVPMIKNITLLHSFLTELILVSERREDMLLSNRLRKIRRAQDLTQQELAKQAGVNYVTISRIESGEASQVYVETVMRLAKALDVTTDMLLGMDEFEITDKEPTQAVEVGVDGVLGLDAPKQEPPVEQASNGSRSKGKRQAKGRAKVKA